MNDAVPPPPDEGTPGASDEPDTPSGEEPFSRPDSPPGDTASDRPTTPPGTAPPPPGTAPPPPGTTPPPQQGTQPFTPPPAATPYSTPPPPGASAPPGAYPPPSAAPYGAPPYPIQRENAPSATAAMVTGIIALASIAVCAGILLPVGIASLVLGKKAQREIEESGGAYGGEGMASAGVIMGWISIALLAIGILAIIFFIIVAALTAPT